MANKLKFYHYWDIKSIINTSLSSLFIIAFFLLVFNYPQIVSALKKANHQATTTGQLMSVTPQTTLSQSQLGNHWRTHHFLVRFSYELDGISYESREFILAAGTVKHQLSQIMASDDKKVVVRYSSSNPKNGILLLE